MVYGHDTCLCVWGEGGGVSCICVLANVYVCICHSHNRKKIFLASKDKNKVLMSCFATYGSYNARQTNHHCVSMCTFVLQVCFPMSTFPQTLTLSAGFPRCNPFLKNKILIITFLAHTHTHTHTHAHTHTYTHSLTHC